MGFAWIFQILNAVPYVVSGIQAIHGSEVAGATKKQLALEALGLAGNVAVGSLTGQNQQYAVAATNLASQLIDTFVGGFKAAGVAGFTPSTPAPTPVVVSGVATPTGAEVPGK